MKRGNYRSQTIDIIALLIFKGGPSWEFLGVNQQGTDAYEIWAGAFGAPHPFAVQQLQLVASVSDDRPLQSARPQSNAPTACSRRSVSIRRINGLRFC
jgi:hypothetical protein